MASVAFISNNFFKYFDDVPIYIRDQLVCLIFTFRKNDLLPIHLGVLRQTKYQYCFFYHLFSNNINDLNLLNIFKLYRLTNNNYLYTFPAIKNLNNNYKLGNKFIIFDETTSTLNKEFIDLIYDMFLMIPYSILTIPDPDTNKFQYDDIFFRNFSNEVSLIVPSDVKDHQISFLN